jgi:hypothetical protein
MLAFEQLRRWRECHGDDGIRLATIWYAAAYGSAGRFVKLIRRTLAWSVLLAVSAAPAAAQDHGEEKVTDFGRRVVALVESYQKGPDGKPLPGDDGWPILVEACNKIEKVCPPTKVGDESHYVDVSLIYDPKAGQDEERKKALAALADLEKEGVFDCLDRLAATKRAVRPAQPGHIMDWLLPELAQARRLARACAARMYLAGEAGDWPKVAASLEEMLGMARAFSHQFSVIEHLVGYAMVDLAAHQVRWTILDRHPGGAAARSIRDVMDRNLPLGPIRIAAQGERINAEDFIGVIYDDPEKTPTQVIALLGGHDIDKATAGQLERLAPKIETKEEARKSAAVYFDGLEGCAGEPFPDALRTAAGLARDLEDGYQKKAVLSCVGPNPLKMLRSAAQVQAEIAGTRIAIAIELFRLKTGQDPDSLNELTPDCLPSVPLDPYSGKPPLYKRGDGPCSNGRYQLYSVGFDGKDDGGIYPETNPAGGAGGEGWDLPLSLSRPNPKEPGAADAKP